MTSDFDAWEALGPENDRLERALAAANARIAALEAENARLRDGQAEARAGAFDEAAERVCYSCCQEVTALAARERARQGEGGGDGD